MATLCCIGVRVMACLMVCVCVCPLCCTRHGQAGGSSAHLQDGRGPEHGPNWQWCFAGRQKQPSPAAVGLPHQCGRPVPPVQPADFSYPCVPTSCRNGRSWRRV
jgi:hypothetical protein